MTNIKLKGYEKLQTIGWSTPVLPNTKKKPYHVALDEHLTSALQASGFSMKYLISPAHFPKIPLNNAV